MCKLLYILLGMTLVTACNGPSRTVSAVPSPPGDTTSFKNPVIWADMPDLSVVRNENDYYLISTTMHLMPGAPVMKSKDLVHWETVSYVFDSLSDNSKYNLLNGTVYGRGQWASSIRYHKGKYYVLFSPNDQPFRAYIYTTADPETEKWQLVSRTPHFHDASLFFDDDDRPFVFTGTRVIELKKDLTGIQPGGINQDIFKKDAEETGLLEGNQVIKYKGRYYLLMISWPRGKPRRQLCYRADNITGPYEKKVILEDEFAGFSFAAQGCIIDDIYGNWYGLIFQDRNGVGRVPLLMRVRWVDGWPMLGTAEGKVPLNASTSLQPYDIGSRVVKSDDFSGSKLAINWQWNHNPVNRSWSLTERPGFLRLSTSRVVPNLYLAPNTITQRMMGPQCSGSILLDVSGMKEGDVSGFSAFNGHSGILAVSMEAGRKYLTMSSNIVELSDKDKDVTHVQSEQLARIALQQDLVYLRIDGDFTLGKDYANFYYSTDGKQWTKIGPEYKMIFDYRKFFMGTRFAIFNYATRSLGGFVDVDFFKFTVSEK
ncbi:glycoside hydrolase family 43 protein [Niabella terrae]